MENHQLINQDSGNVEYYTPQFITAAFRLVMGGIDLDPASSLKANERVRAGRIFTIDDDGLSQDWFGRVFMNHPFSREGNPLWIRKVVREFEIDRVSQFGCITFAATSEAWFAPLGEFPQCFLRPRTNYELPDGTLKKGVTKGSVTTYGGPNVNKFIEVFKPLGTVVLPARMFGRWAEEEMTIEEAARRVMG